MGSFFQEIINILTIPPGNLTYHLVLGLSVTGALQSALNNWRSSEFPQGKRMVIGMSLILAARLVLFLSAGIAWQGLIDEHLLLPPVDRAISLFSMIIIIWLWVFPEPSRRADAASILLSLLTLTMLAFTLLWWYSQGSDIPYNGSGPDFIGEFIALVIILSGGLMLLVRRPNGWEFGLSMMGLLFIGHLAYLVIPSPESDFAGIVRLAEIAAYPMLLTLPQRFTAPTSTGESILQPLIKERRRYGTDPRYLPAILDLGTETDPKKIGQAITRAISQNLLADICLLVSPPDADGQMTIQSGYDLIREKAIEGVPLNSRMIPVITSAFNRGRPLRLPASSTSSDLTNLGQLLNMSLSGHLLAAPITSSSGDLLSGIIVLSPHSGRSWTTEDQTYLTNFTQPLASLLQRTDRLAQLKNQLAQAQQSLQAAQTEVDQTHLETENLRAQLASAPEISENNHPQAASMAALIIAQEEAQEIIARLQAENERLKKGDLQPSTTEHTLSEFQAPPPPVETEHLVGELRMALEEIANLKTAISESDQRFLAIRDKLANASPSDNQFQVVASIAQELRQPMSSIIGYTDFLLGESVGILGALQRKFLDRVKTSSERMGRLIDDLLQIISLETGQLQLDSEWIDLNGVIDEAITNLNQQLDKKNISLQIDLEEQLPNPRGNRDALKQTIIYLLENACVATSNEGEITVNARVESSDEERNYVLLSVSDQGGGIPIGDIPKVFSRHYHNGNAEIPGIGDKGIGLSVAKSLVEALGGRIWVDSEQGIGSVFSILLPVSPIIPPNGEHGETPE